MNLFDVAALLLVLIAVILGSRSGAVPQLAGLVGAVAGGAVAVAAIPPMATVFEVLDPLPRAIAVLLFLLLAVGLGEAIGSAVGQLAGSRLRTSAFGAVDRVGGAFVGAAQAVLIIWLAGGLLAAGPIRTLAAQAQTSTAVRTLSDILPPPTEIALELGRLLNTSGLPDVFVGLEPLAAPPVDPPADPQARAIAAAAAPSVGKVAALTCGAQSSGTGFAVAAGYVVTNAHVVAGGRTVRFNLGDRLHDATVVLFDPDLDVALLHVPDLAAPGLRFAASDPSRGAVGVALGFPAGGSLAVLPAAVTARYPARGRDIYTDNIVTRTILELRARVDPGDSGGPLVLADGTVGGVVFAEARSNEAVGYALSPTAVAVRIQPALGRTSAVDLGECIQ